MAESKPDIELTNSKHDESRHPQSQPPSKSNTSSSPPPSSPPPTTSSSPPTNNPQTNSNNNNNVDLHIDDNTEDPPTDPEAISIDNHPIHRPSHLNPSDLPALRASRGKTKLKFRVGLGIILLDLAVLPIVYFYVLRFATGLDEQLVFAVFTGIFGMLCFVHYAFRSLRLFMHRTGKRYRPLGWTRWGLAEFLHTNIAGIIFCIETELVVGTIPQHPWVPLCAMPTATICYYCGILLLLSGVLTVTNRRLPFNMSSIPKGQPWVTALYPIIEDFGALEMSGERAFRKQFKLRYEASPRFREMLMTLTWAWGVGFLVTGAAATVAIMMLPEDIGFGVGWFVPWVCVTLMTFATVAFVQRSLRRERAEWRSNKPHVESSSELS